MSDFTDRVDNDLRETVTNLKSLRMKAGELAMYASVAEIAITEGWSHQSSGVWRKNYDSMCSVATDIRDLLNYFKL